MKIETSAIIEAYKKGQSINSIANTFGTYPTSVRRILERNDIELRHDSRKKGELYVQNGEKLLEWAKVQGRLVTKAYVNKLYDWLKKNNIPYKPNDRTVLEGVSVDALLLGEYSNLAIHISERATYVSKKKHEENIKQKMERAEKAGIRIIFLNKDHFENLGDVKLLLDSLKS